MSKRAPRNTPAVPPNPSGLCMCGCGERTPLARHSSTERGWVRGEPIKYVPTHGARATRRGPDYVVDPATGCWEWQHQTIRNGYGRGSFGGVAKLAHRHYYEQARGPIPDGTELDHLCRNRRCVNPEHLEPVTRATNTRRGAATKLTAEQVAQIKASSDSYSAIAMRFGVSKGCIQAIKRGDTWKDIEPPEEAA